MTTESSKQSALFPKGVLKKPVAVRFDDEGQSSDGGVMLLSQLDSGIGLTRNLAKHLLDERDQERVLHQYELLFKQRVFGIALGYSDCNDFDRLRSDPCLKMACGQDPLSPETDLGSQPTLSRFENSQSARNLITMQREMESFVIKRLSRRNGNAKLVTIDLDPTVDPVHGQQIFSFFHGHYDTSCFLPQLGFLTIGDDPEQYLFCARLRPGNARCSRNAIPLLRRVVPELRKRFPKATIRVRLDGGFQNPMMLDVLDELGVQYLVAMAGNSILKQLAEPMMVAVRKLSEESGDSERMYGDAKYKAKTWKVSRRVVIKAECVQHPGRSMKDNARFVITNMRSADQKVYEAYCERGDSENRIKEMKDLDMDRTSCSRFLANQLRLTISATAYVLLQELRRRLRYTEAARSQVGRLRLMLLKIGTRVVESCRRIVLHFPRSHPWSMLWIRAARATGASLP